MPLLGQHSLTVGDIGPENLEHATVELGAIEKEVCLEIIIKTAEVEVCRPDSNEL